MTPSLVEHGNLAQYVQIQNRKYSTASPQRCTAVPQLPPPAVNHGGSNMLQEQSSHSNRAEATNPSNPTRCPPRSYRYDQ